MVGIAMERTALINGSSLTELSNLRWRNCYRVAAPTITNPCLLQTRNFHFHVLFSKTLRDGHLFTTTTTATTTTTLRKHTTNWETEKQPCQGESQEDHRGRPPRCRTRHPRKHSTAAHQQHREYPLPTSRYQKKHPKTSYGHRYPISLQMHNVRRLDTGSLPSICARSRRHVAMSQPAARRR